MVRTKFSATKRAAVWDYYIGKEKGVSSCYCCGITEIHQLAFECGHVISVANRGTDDITNLRPICSLCNKSMGTKDMNTFMEQNTSSIVSYIKNPVSLQELEQLCHKPYSLTYAVPVYVQWITYTSQYLFNNDTIMWYITNHWDDYNQFRKRVKNTKILDWETFKANEQANLQPE